MATVVLLSDAEGGDIDWSLTSTINGLARDLPHGVDAFLGFLGEYGVPLASVLLLFGAWLWARCRPDAAVSVAAVLWSGLAAGVALILNVPVRAMVERPRPFVSHPGQLDLLMDHQPNGSFASDHATFTMALAVGLVLVNRRFGMIALGLAGLEGLLRVFMGVHYPTDIVGGFALGTATTLLLAPIAMAVLTPFVHAVSRTALAPLVQAPHRTRRTRLSAQPTGPLTGTSGNPDTSDDEIAA